MSHRKKGTEQAKSTIKYIEHTIFKTVEEALKDTEKTLKIKGLSESNKEYFEAQRDTFKKHIEAQEANKK